ncbi:MAG: hypothetical protein KDC42_09750 [Ignavibacteriae bacterium]|nr:hypothetical protein [Ignavibacteriota bacterium]
MLKSKALDIISTFSSNEIKDFREFLSSPFFNTNKTLIKFYDQIAKFYPDFSKEPLSKEYLFKKLHPDEEYRDEVVRNLLSRLLALGESFLKIKGMENDEFGSDIYLVEELNRRKLGSLFEKNVSKMMTNLPEKDTDGFSYLIRFKLETERFNYIISNKKISSPLDIEEVMQILIKMGEQLINFFVMKHLNEMDSLEKFSKLYNYKIDNTLPVDFSKRIKFTELLDYLVKRKDENSIIYEIYLNLIKAFENIKDTKYYKNLKKLLIQNADSLTQDEKHFLFGKLLDYGTLKNRLDAESKFEDEHFSNYKMHLEKEYYLHSKNPYLSIDLFRNSMILSIRRKDFDWTEKLINNYIKKLKKDYQENMYHYAMSFLNFQKGDYEKALTEINQVVFDFFAFKYDVRNLNLMICYELGNWETVKSIIESYKRFLLNNKNVGKDRKEFYGNFIKFLTKLVKLRDEIKKVDKIERDYLKDEIIKTKNFSYKEWILDKVNEL